MNVAEKLEKAAALHAGASPETIVGLAHELAEPIASYCLFSGGHDSTVLAHRCRNLYGTLVFVDTGTAVPGVVDFVREFAELISKPLIVLEHDHDAYRALVLGEGEERRGDDWQPLGFPGPGQHGRAYNRLKERQLERLLRETKAGYPRSAQVLALTGVRRDESKRRAGRPAISKKRAWWFCNPLIDWTNDAMHAYRAEHDLPESDAAAFLHRSGECNCGAFAARGEREMLQSIYPDWFEKRIASLEREAVHRGIKNCRWGNRPGEKAAGAGELCTDCALRVATA